MDTSIELNKILKDIKDVWNGNKKLFELDKNINNFIDEYKKIKK